MSFENIHDCYNAGNIYANEIAGGIVGQNYGKLSSVYNIASISAEDSVGAIVGSTSKSPENAYYLADCVSGTAGGFTYEQMSDKNSFVGFDFINVWEIGTDVGYKYPTLISLDHIEHVHSFSSVCDTACDSCEYERIVSHDYGTSWTRDENSHFHVCSLCGDRGSVGAHEYDDDCDSICNVCNYDRNVFHNFSGAWYTDKYCHWHQCTVCGEKKDEEAHVPGKEADEDSAQTCKICAYVINPPLGHIHSYTGKWKSDDSGHYKTCSCGASSDTEPHMWDNGTVTKAPTETSEGVMTYACTVCSKNTTQIIDRLVPEEDNGQNSEDNSDASENTDSADTDKEELSENPSEESTEATNNVTVYKEKSSGVSLALSISAIVISVLNLAMFAVIIVLILKTNGRKK